MSAEVQLKPGWLMRDVQKASHRLTEWTKPRNESLPHKQAAEHKTTMQNGERRKDGDEGRNA